MLMGILLGVVVAAWIGVAVYSSQFKVEINPNVDQFLQPIERQFNTEVVTELTERIKILKISPKVFHDLQFRVTPPTDEDFEENSAN